MKNITVLNRILLFLTVILAAYQVVVSGNGEGVLTTWAYTIGFGVFVVAGLVLIILGYESLENPIVVIISTIIPLAISLGLISKYFPDLTAGYFFFTVVGFLVIIISRFVTNQILATILLAAIHGISGIVIFLLPIILSIQGITPNGFCWVGIGGALIGLGGLLLSFLKSGRPILSKSTIMTILPGLFLLTMIAFGLGFAAI